MKQTKLYLQDTGRFGRFVLIVETTAKIRQGYYVHSKSLRRIVRERSSLAAPFVK